jgi:hypothetical protein
MKITGALIAVQFVILTLIQVEHPQRQNAADFHRNQTGQAKNTKSVIKLMEQSKGISAKKLLHRTKLRLHDAASKAALMTCYDSTSNKRYTKKLAASQ